MNGIANVNGTEYLTESHEYGNGGLKIYTYQNDGDADMHALAQTWREFGFTTSLEITAAPDGKVSSAKLTGKGVTADCSSRLTRREHYHPVVVYYDDTREVETMDAGVSLFFEAPFFEAGDFQECDDCGRTAPVNDAGCCCECDPM